MNSSPSSPFLLNSHKARRLLALAEQAAKVRVLHLVRAGGNHVLQAQHEGQRQGTYHAPKGVDGILDGGDVAGNLMKLMKSKWVKHGKTGMDCSNVLGEAAIQPVGCPNCPTPTILRFQTALRSIHALYCTRILVKTMISDYISITSGYFPIQSQLWLLLKSPKKISHLHHMLQQY